MPLTLTLKSPMAKRCPPRLRAHASGTAYYQHAIQLPGDAPTGRWLLEARIDPAAKRPDAAWGFQVEEFLPERMKLELQAPEAALQGSDPLHIEVTGNYLYGALPQATGCWPRWRWSASAWPCPSLGPASFLATLPTTAPESARSCPKPSWTMAQGQCRCATGHGRTPLPHEAAGILQPAGIGRAACGALGGTQLVARRGAGGHSPAVRAGCGRRGRAGRARADPPIRRARPCLPRACR